MRRALVSRMPALTRFTYGALNPLTVEQFTYGEISEYLIQLDQYEAEIARQQQGGG